MKKIMLWLMVLAVVIIAGPLSAQDSKKVRDSIRQETIKNLVDSRVFDFIAQSATPMSGRIRYLNTDYSLELRKDSMTADLPYFGRAYAAPINPTEGGIRFNSGKFQYEIKNARNRGWNIRIRPKDVSDIQVLKLQVSANGYATLQVTSTSRQAISFNGYIRERNQRRK